MTDDIRRCRHLGLVVDEAFEAGRAPRARARRRLAFAAALLALCATMIGLQRVDTTRSSGPQTRATSAQGRTRGRIHLRPAVRVPRTNV